MKPWSMILLRLYCFTLGRISFFSALLKKILIHVLIRMARKKYVAASSYFDYEIFVKHSVQEKHR
jgi:hypothetical protein